MYAIRSYYVNALIGLEVVHQAIVTETFVHMAMERIHGSKFCVADALARTLHGETFEADDQFEDVLDVVNA